MTKEKYNGVDNLIPFSERSKEEAKELGAKGGIKSGEVRRARKTLKEELLLMLEDEDTQKKLSTAIITRAMLIDTMGNKAFEIIRDTVDEKPKEVIETNQNVTMSVEYQNLLKDVQERLNNDTRTNNKE